MKATKTWVFIVLLIISAINVHAWPIPDTGQTRCYNNTEERPCPNPGESFYGQDGNYTINPPSFTKLDPSGNSLPEWATSWAMVKDNVTGLTWENKTSDGSIHDGAKTFTWCDTNPATNGGYQGTCGTGTGGSATDTATFIKALNDVTFGGISDWRMPTPKELASIADLSRESPAINMVWFPNTVSSGYWSSTTYASSMDRAWDVFFEGGHVENNIKTTAKAVRAVRGGQVESGYIDNGDGTVTDTATGLMWQQETVPGKIWQFALDYAETLSLAGYKDWRLPTKTELQTIVDFKRKNPAIDTTFFPNTLSSQYWSSTTSAVTINGRKGDSAWSADFAEGRVYGVVKPSSYAVRAVRGGHSGSVAALIILKSGSGTVSSSLIGIACGASFCTAFATGTNVTLTATPDAGAEFIGWSGGDCSGVSTTCQMTMDGDKTVKATFTTADTTGPTGTATINGGAAYATNPAVTLTLSASDPSGVTEMKFSNNNTNWSATETYGTTKAWTLSSGDGYKTVYVKYKDGKGNWSGAMAATITLDTTTPVTMANPPAGIYNAAQNVTLTANETATIYYTTNGTDPTMNSPTYAALPIPIPRTTMLKFFAKDNAGNLEMVKTQIYTINENGMPGEMNNDTRIDLADAILVLQIAIGDTSQTSLLNYMTADVNSDGKIGLAEVIYILQKIAGMR